MNILSPANVIGAPLALVPVALSDGATISTNAALGSVFTVTLGGSRTIANPTNPSDGQVIVYRLKQDGTGGRTITWGSAFQFTNGAPTLATAASAVDMLHFVYNAGDSKWDFIAPVRSVGYPKQLGYMGWGS